jgi:hypothetical protein
MVGQLVLMAGMAYSAPAPGELTSLRGHARAIDYDASLQKLPDGTSWIRTSVHVEAVFDGTLSDAVAILDDYENYPKVFSRISAVKLRSKAKGVTVMDQRNLVAVMGLRYETNLVFRSEFLPRGPGRMAETFAMTESDGSTRVSEGSWELEEVCLDTGPAVYLRYYCLILVEPRFPMQLQIMQSFGKADFVKTVEELGAAMKKRR